MKKFIIDRFEEDKAVLECENGEMATLDITALPKKVKEGDVLCFEEGSYFLNEQETQERKDKIKKLMEDLFV